MSNCAARIDPPVDELDLSGVLLRTDYTDDDRFTKVLADSRRPAGAHGVYGAKLLVVEDPCLARITPEQIIELVDVEDFAFVADARSMVDSTLLVVDLFEDSDTYLTAFRVIPEAVLVVEANLVLANLDFADLLDVADSDGVFRETFGL
ncbi:DUF6924 domain-containing protein [Promicromonospora sukumoe]|uniref:DUF6924 domain-containing protein n=1 Tax=Promicromonospora sukumoe TaxID=88382 RepID=UPI0037C5409A